MKTFAIALMLLPLGPSIAAAQAAKPTPASTPAAPAAAASTLDADTPIETLYASPAGKAVLDRNLPLLAKHEQYEVFKTMSLRQVAAFSDGKITDAMITKIDTELKAAK